MKSGMRTARNAVTTRKTHMGLGITARRRLGLAAILPVIAILLLGTASAHAESRIGGSVDVRGPVDGMNVVGGIIEINGPVDGKVNAVGGSIELNGSVDGNVRLVGGKSTVNAQIDGSMSIAGGEVNVLADSRIANDVDIAAGEAIMAGDVEGDVKIAAGEITVSGRFAGDTELRGRDITIDPQAFFGGDLLIAAREEPSIPDGVTITGTYTFEELSGFRIYGHGFDGAVFEPGSPRFAGLAVAWAFLAGLAIIFLVPRATGRVVAMLSNRPGMSFLYGIGFVVLFPLVAGLLCATVIGIPLGVPMLLAYPFLLMVGFVFGAVGLARLFLNRRSGTPGMGGQIAALFGVLIVLAIVSLIPVIGGLVMALLLLAGTGALGAVLLYGERAYTADMPQDAS